MLSKRLQTVADMVTKGNIVADIGTDHGYVPIYLVENKISPKAYALDINKGPIDKAERHVKEMGLSDKIITIQSDGMEMLKQGQGETTIIAGMGGDLVIEILKKSSILHTVKELILSPQKKIDQVRDYILNNGWKIVCEKMVFEGGKYYTVMKAVQEMEMNPYSSLELIYGRCLLESKDVVLKKYLDKQRDKFTEVLKVMKVSDSENIARVDEILENNRKATEIYD